MKNYDFLPQPWRSFYLAWLYFSGELNELKMKYGIIWLHFYPYSFSTSSWWLGWRNPLIGLNLLIYRKFSSSFCQSSTPPWNGQNPIGRVIESIGRPYYRFLIERTSSCHSSSYYYDIFDWPFFQHQKDRLKRITINININMKYFLKVNWNPHCSM